MEVHENRSIVPTGPFTLKNNFDPLHSLCF